MARRIAFAFVGLDLDDADGAAATDKDLVQEVRRGVEGGARVEGARQRLEFGGAPAVALAVARVQTVTSFRSVSGPM